MNRPCEQSAIAGIFCVLFYRVSPNRIFMRHRSLLIEKKKNGDSKC